MVVLHLHLAIATALLHADARTASLARVRIAHTPRCCDVGVQSDAVRVEERPGFGRALIAARAIEEGEPVLSIPQEMILCPSRYVNELAQMGPSAQQLSAAFAPLLETAEGQSTLLALALLHELALGERSRFASYVASLPQADALGIRGGGKKGRGLLPDTARGATLPHEAKATAGKRGKAGAAPWQ